MSTLYLSLSNTVDNNGGTVMKGGNVNNAQNYLDMTNVSGNYSLDGYPYSSVPVENSSATKALVGGSYVFAYNNSKPLAKGATVTINIGSLGHDLFSPGTKDVSLITGIHSRTTNTNRLDTTAIRNNQYNEFTGKFEEGYPLVSEDAFGNDTAASVSRENPGTLRFTLGKTIESKQYNSKTG